MNKFTFGFDVEVPLVVEDESTLNNTIIPAHLVCPHSKKDPGSYYSPHGSWAMHWDNVAFEMATPVFESGFFAEDTAISMVLREIIKDAVNNLSRESGKSLRELYRPTIRITGDMEELYPQLTVFGCDPDYDAYTREKNVSPTIQEARGLRSFSGHMHFGFVDPKEAGFDVNNLEHYAALARAFDAYVGLRLKTFNLLNAERMSLYGKAGAFRFKPEYPGIEYRVPSNEWVATDVFHTGWFNDVCNGWKFFLEDESKELSYEIREVMNAAEWEEVHGRSQILESYLKYGFA